MTDAEKTPDWPIPTGQYRYLANWLVEHNADAAMQLVDATSERTDYELATRRAAVEGILGISFGLIARLRIDEPSLNLARDIGNAWGARAVGIDLEDAKWISLFERASRRLEDAENAGAEQGVLTALRGLVAACSPNLVYTVRDIFEHAVIAWNQEVENQHAAVIVWATDIVTSSTRISRKANDDE